MMVGAHKVIASGLTFSLTYAFGAGQTAFAYTSESLSALTLPESIAPFGVGFATGAVVVGAACALAIKLEDRKVQQEFVEDVMEDVALSDKTHVIDAATPCVGSPLPEIKTNPQQDAFTATADPSVTAYVARTTSSDIVDVAKNYVERQTLAERLKTQAKGVAAVLSERLGKDRFDDLPVIQRADGTVGDVGTPWWNDRMGDSVLRVGAFEHDGNTAQSAALTQAAISAHPTNEEIRPLTRQRYVGTPLGNISAIRLSKSLPGFEGVEQRPHISGATAAAIENVKLAAGIGTGAAAAHVVSATTEATGEAIPAHVSIYGTGAMPATSASWKAQTQLQTPPLQSVRSRQILGRTAEGELGAQAKGRDAQELEADDLWQRAMGAMDEKINNQTPNFFEDTIGNAETIDEIEGLEAKTTFIPFKTPAGHPEVVDTESYVDYLIGEEFNQNSSKSVRKSSRDYLRVIEGGSVPQNTRRLMRAARAAQAQANAQQKAKSKHSSGSTNTKPESYRPKHLKVELSSPFAEAKEA